MYKYAYLGVFIICYTSITITVLNGLYFTHTGFIFKKTFTVLCKGTNIILLNIKEIS
jgi:hypothetical protein